MSPEHARGEGVDARADLFAVGIVLWELIAGRRMYKAEAGRPPLLEQARRAEIPELPERGFAHEEELRAIVKKALAVDRAERYPTAQAMLRDLEAYMGKARLIASPLRLGEWLVAKFGSDIVTQRRARERALSALELGAPVVLEALPKAPPPLASVAPPPAAATPLPHAQPAPLPFITGAGAAAVGPFRASDVPAPPSSTVATAMDISPHSSQLPIVPVTVRSSAQGGRSK